MEINAASILSPAILAPLIVYVLKYCPNHSKLPSLLPLLGVTRTLTNHNTRVHSCGVLSEILAHNSVTSSRIEVLHIR